MKLTQETRVTTPDGFLTHDSLIEFTGGYVSKRGQERFLIEHGIRYTPGKNVLWVREEDAFGISGRAIKPLEKINQEPDFSAIESFGNRHGKKAKRPAHKGANST